MVDEHSYTYTSRKLIHITHRLRLKETLNLVSNKINSNVNKIADFGGGSGFIGDKVADRCNNINSQYVFDIVHPLNERNPNRRMYSPHIKTNYRTFNLNTDEINTNLIDSSFLIICSETIEHVGDPFACIEKLINSAAICKCELYISFPIERGIKGFIKFLVKLLIGRYFRKRTIKSLILQILWFLGFIKNIRKDKDLYPDHDGFEDIKLSKFIKTYCFKRNLKMEPSIGLFTRHFYIKPNN